MKKQIGFFAIMILLFSFKFIQDNSKATVEQKEGIYIFILCKPVSAYDYLGSVKKGISLTGQPDEMINSMLKKVHKEFPTGTGIVFTSVAMDKADVIRFKEN